jgi:ligand-binding SRPBCC domain-containing protein
VHLVLGVVPLKQRWVSIITESEQKENYFRFVDKGAVLPFPFATWEHEHIVLQLPNGKVRIEDNIRYTTAPIIFEKMLYPLLLLQFGYRKKAYPRFFSRKAIK